MNFFTAETFGKNGIYTTKQVKKGNKVVSFVDKN